MKYLIVVLLLLVSSAACRPTPPSIVTPQGHVAYQSEDALDAIALLQHTVITLRRANVVTTPTMRAVVKSTMAAAQMIAVAIDNGTGQRAAYRDAITGLTNAETSLSPDQLAKLRGYFDTAIGILTVLAGGVEP